MSPVTAVLLLRAFSGIAGLYAALRTVTDFRDRKWGWATIGLLIAISGLILAAVRLPIFTATAEALGK